MHCTIKHIATERELDAALALDEKVFGVPSGRNSPAYAREKWLERMKDAGDLMLYAELGGEAIGIVFGRIENESAVTVGPVAVDERYRKHGIARALMLMLETRALGHGINRLVLGAAESAEGFYQKLGYTGALLIQSEKHSIDELLSLNTHTQMVLGKTIGTEDMKMTNDIGNYARHAKFWDWSGHDRTAEFAYWHGCAKRYGNNVLIPMCAWGDTGAYMAERGMSVTAFDITPEMIEEGKKRFGDVPGLRFLLGDVRDFRIDMAPADFCYCADFGHIHTMEEIQKALVCINNHLRDGGGLIIETGLPSKTSNYVSTETFYPLKQMYPSLKVWKTGETRNDAASGRCYISQIFYMEDENGHVERFDHAFYLQSFPREAWLDALAVCGFDVVGEYRDRERQPWCEGDGYWIVEAVKSSAAKRRYSPAVSFDFLQTPIYRYENVALYNDYINLQQPNDGYLISYRFDINADGEWVGWINVKIGYSISAYYNGQIGYTINDECHRNRGFMTKACLALRPFLRQCGYRRILITTDENNAASRRVCEKIGATLLEIVDTPTWTGIYRQGQRRTCIYEWTVEDVARQRDASNLNLRHLKIDLARDREYLLERHCRVNYACDTPWARKQSYEAYRANWFANAGQREGYWSALAESMEDARTIAEIIRNESEETVGYLWVPFHGEDASFQWADVQDLYVEEACRGTGVAADLMDYAENAARRNGAKVIRSGTGCENIQAQGLHRKMGYYQYRMEYEKNLGEGIGV